MFEKILNYELVFVNLIMDKNITIMFSNNDDYIYLEVLDFNKIEMFDEKFFDVDKYGLQATPDIYGIYEMKSKELYKTLLIVGFNDILIVKSYDYKLSNNVEMNYKIVESNLERIDKINVLNYRINEIKVGEFPGNNIKSKIDLDLKGQKIVYISRNYFEAFKIEKKNAI